MAHASRGLAGKTSVNGAPPIPPPPENTRATAVRRAVFLSYASEDAATAARLCAGLRETGIEVWLDQSELRGGDAWDHRIREQIRQCELFIPVISHATQARAEGYFRLEWDLADQRRRMIARRKAFIVPVVVDNTPESGAEVPDSFLEVHWTRLPAGQTSAAFCDRIAALLDDRAVKDGTPAPAPPESGRARPAPAMRRRTLLVAAALLAVAAGWVAWRLLPPGVLVGSRAAHPPDAATGAARDEKSIAVLPFVNMSADQSQEYFADGLSEELIDHLARNPQLKVIARTSSFAFKGKSEDIRAIAATLGVAHVLEGSVRKSGSDLRITAQLIRAVDGRHLWSQTYERKLTDILKIQDEISTTVATALNVLMGADGRPAPPVATNIEAYNLLLKGNYFLARVNKNDAVKALELYQEALRLQPDYALAWVQLGTVYAQQADNGWAPAAVNYPRARAAAARAVELAPDLAATHIFLAWTHVGIDWDWAAARAEFERARALEPENTKIARGLARVNHTIYGELAEEIALRQEELVRNPLDLDQLGNLAWLQMSAGRLEEAAATYRNLLQLNPAFAGGPAGLGLTLALMGRLDAALTETNKDVDENIRLAVLPIIYWAQHRRSESDRALQQLIHQAGESGPYSAAGVHAYRGEADAAFDWLERAYRLHDVGLTLIRSDPLFAALRADRRYAALLAKMKLVQP